MILNYPFFENQQAQKALALLIMVALLWMTEAIPLALTGLLMPMHGSHFTKGGEVINGPASSYLKQQITNEKWQVPNNKESRISLNTL